MAVVIRRKVLIDGASVDLKTYQPSGHISKEERERADKLDMTLSVQIPALAQRMLEIEPRHQETVHRWYVLGAELRTLISRSRLVLGSDVSSGLIWQAIWFYLPANLKPIGSSGVDAYAVMQHKRKDHLSLCYEISFFQWSEVAWIQRWDDWHQLAFRPGLVRDPRIVRSLGSAISALPKYPSREVFRGIVKKLGEAFPTRKHRDSSLLSNDTIGKTIAQAVCEPFASKVAQVEGVYASATKRRRGKRKN